MCVCAWSYEKADQRRPDQRHKSSKTVSISYESKVKSKLNVCIGKEFRVGEGQDGGGHAKSHAMSDKAKINREIHDFTRH